MTQPAGQRRIPMSRLQLPHPMSLQVFEEYEQAQRAVDYLSDREFPVENVMIVGTDLKQVERVTGRLTAGRILASGAASGAWMGAFFGLLMWAFAQGGGAAAFLTAVLVGAIFGMIWALILYRFTGGARDFTSVMQVVATRYEVLVESNLIGVARALLEDQRRGVPSDAGRDPQSRAPGLQQPAGPSTGFPGSPGLSGAPGHEGPPPPMPTGATARPPYGAAGAGAPYPPPVGEGPHDVPAAAPEPPKYLTYGEALDAERAARRPAAPQAPDAGPGPTERPNAAGPSDDSAAEDAHDAPVPGEGRGA